MAKDRPMEFLRRLGARIKARRLHQGMTQVELAKAAKIAATGLIRYESGQGHPPAETLHRLAVQLNTTSSRLMGESTTKSRNGNENQLIDDLTKLYAHPTIGMVTRYMQDMSKEDRLRMRMIALVFANRNNDIHTSEVKT